MVNMMEDSKSHVEVDALPLEHPSIVQYLKHRKGVPVFSNTEGAVVVETPIDVLGYCIGILNKDLNSRFTIAIRNKLLDLV
jgi:hypothetical protein